MLSSSGTSTARAIGTRCITRSVRDESFGAGDPDHYPAPPGTGSSHRDSLQRPVRSPVLYQAEMQELNEFFKLVLGSDYFFFNFPSRQGGQKSCRLLQAGLCHIDSVISQKQ